MTINELSEPVRALCEAFVHRLGDIIPDNLHGVYLHGSAVFPESGPDRDVDCFVVLNQTLTGDERSALLALQEELAESHAPLGKELDAWFILHEEAGRQDAPTHQLKPSIRDYSWALHCEHIKAKRYIALLGPEPRGIFPRPSADRVIAALGNELAFINANLKYPDYCILNLCRIMSSLKNSDAVVSKRSSGQWAANQYPEWSALITAADRSYAGSASETELAQIKTDLSEFHKFAVQEIEDLRNPEN